MAQIVPALLATSELEYQEKLQKIESIGEFLDGWVQIDLMDNKFVQNKSVDPQIIAKYPTPLKKEAHLMVEDPDSLIDELKEMKVERIIFPIETEKGVDSCIFQIKKGGIQAGLSINPQTPVAKVAPFVGKIDVVLLMSVNPGFGGQEFLEKTYDRVKELVELRKDQQFLIEVDGGITPQIAASLEDLGVDIVVVGSKLLDGDIKENLAKFKTE